MIAILVSDWGELEASKNCLELYHRGNREDLEFMRGKLHGKEVILGRTGIGINRARKGTNYIIQKFKPELIISAGHGGALSPELRVGDIVVGDWVLSTKKEMRKMLNSDVPKAIGGFRRGGIVTESRFVYSSAEKKSLREQSGALTVDMETWGVAEAVEDYGTPLFSLRSISDESNFDLPNMGFLYNTNGWVNKKQAIKYLLSRPALIYPYVKFTYFNLKKSSQSLNIFLREFLQHI